MTPTRTFRLSTAAACVLVAAGGAVAQTSDGNLFVNPGLDQQNCAEGWTVQTVDAVVVCSQGNGTVWLNHNNLQGDPTISQTVSGLVAGQNYRIEAQWKPGPTAALYAPGQNQIFGIGVDGTMQPFTIQGDGGSFQTSVHEFTASGSTATISFSGELGSTDGDVLLDSAQIFSVGTEVDTTIVNGVEVGTGDVRVTLTWNTAADLDLYVTDPQGEEIYYGRRQAASGGQLDVDANASCGNDPAVENVFWPVGGAPMGAYNLRVNYYSACGAGPTQYEVTVSVNGQVIDTHTGTLSSDMPDVMLPAFTR